MCARRDVSIPVLELAFSRFWVKGVYDVSIPDYIESLNGRGCLDRSREQGKAIQRALPADKDVVDKEADEYGETLGGDQSSVRVRLEKVLRGQRFPQVRPWSGA